MQTPPPATGPAAGNLHSFRKTPQNPLKKNPPPFPETVRQTGTGSRRQQARYSEKTPFIFIHLHRLLCKRECRFFPINPVTEHPSGQRADPGGSPAHTDLWNRSASETAFARKPKGGEAAGAAKQTPPSLPGLRFPISKYRAEFLRPDHLRGSPPGEDGALLHQ